MLLPLLISAIVAQAPAAPATSAGGPVIVIETEAGNIRVRLDPIHAPGTVANFLRYVDDSFFDHAFFYRTVTTHPDNQPNKQVKIDVIQGGVNDAKDTYAPVPLERTSVTGLEHLDGTISMARDGPDTATSEFFICVGDQPELDFGGHRNPDGQGFAAFGQVIDGMDIVRRIHDAPAEGQVLDPPIAIIRIVRETPAR
jgi:peptidyl-prolyl cis-trans isomerase A (cyclophilin A)